MFNQLGFWDAEKFFILLIRLLDFLEDPDGTGGHISDQFGQSLNSHSNTGGTTKKEKVGMTRRYLKDAGGLPGALCHQRHAFG